MARPMSPRSAPASTFASCLGTSASESPFAKPGACSAGPACSAMNSDAHTKLLSHEDVRCGPGAGRAKGKPRKKKAVDAASSSQSAPPTASGSSAAPGARPSSSRAYSTAASSPAQPTYAEPGAKKRAISLPGSDGTANKAAKGSRAKGRGKGKAKAVEFAEEDEAFEEKADEAPQPKKKKAKEREGGIDLLLAQKFDLDTRKKDPKGYWMSEKRALHLAILAAFSNRASLNLTLRLSLQLTACALTGMASRLSGRASAIATSRRSGSSIVRLGSAEPVQASLLRPL